MEQQQQSSSKVKSILSSGSKNQNKKSAASMGANLTMSNSIWIRDDAIKNEYATFISDNFDGSVLSLPSNYDPINEMITQQSKGMIKNPFQWGHQSIPPRLGY